MMEHLISTTLIWVAGKSTYIVQKSVMKMHYYGREAKVFLYCNESATSPVATTDGDSKVTDHYVHNIKDRVV